MLTPGFLMHRVELKVGLCAPSSRIDLRFLMHRVELKVGLCAPSSRIDLRFLMHRVELKDSPKAGRVGYIILPVPNAPCGVESLNFLHVIKVMMQVPNAPCGVES